MRILYKSIKLLSALFIPILAILFLSLSKDQSSAIICSSGYCLSSNQWVNSYVRIGGGSCHYISYYSCNGDPNNCVTDGVTTYSNSTCTSVTRSGLGCCGSAPPAPTCTDCTPTCPSGTADSPNTGYSTTASCSRGTGCDPATNTKTCYYQRQPLCSSASTSKLYLKAGESTNITANANTNVNYFTYVFYNRDHVVGVPQAICTTYTPGWAESQGACPAGTYQLVRSNYYSTARSSETTTIPANNIFVNDLNYGGALVTHIQVNVYFRINDRPISLPDAACVVTEDYCTTCSPTACTSPYQTSATSFGTKIFTCTNSPSACGTESRTCYCSSACTPANCPSDLSNTNLGFGVSSLTVSCTNACSSVSTRSCYCKDCALSGPVGTTPTNTGKQSTDPAYQSTSCSRGTGCADKTGPLYCVRCTPPACGPTYATSNQGYGTKVLSCNNTLASCGTESNTCYCYACTPPACAPTYSTTNYGYGTVTLNCTNNCSVVSNRTCYVDKCDNCTLPSCPSPLSNTPTTANPDLSLSNFVSCTRSVPCGGPAKYGSCYETASPQPTTNLQIFPDAANKYGFSSTTHTGTRMTDYNLNDPINMTATYTDVNGATDIEAVSVWFRDASLSGEVTSPLMFAETSGIQVPPPRAESNDSWGFMMRWNGSSWLPYVPAYVTIPPGGVLPVYSTIPTWVPAVYSNNSFVIPGPSGLQMVRVTIGNSQQASITRSGNNVVLPFQLSFNFTSGFENVAQITYQTYLMGNDVFSFTPNDNYSFSVDAIWAPGQLRYRTSPAPAQLYARQWAFGGYNWTIDKEVPNVENLDVTVIGDTRLQLNWRVSDSKEIYAIVGNLYASITMPPNPPDLTLTGTGLDIVSPYTLSTDDTNLANLNTGYAFRKLSIGGTESTGNLTIDIGSNKEGSIVIYLTVFDKAGNMYTRSLAYSLGDWISTEGGLVYSSEGMDYEVKSVADANAWSAVTALTGMFADRADVSSELFADNQTSGTTPIGLDKSTLLHSYHLRPFNIEIQAESLYDQLKKAYNKRAIDGKTDLTDDLPVITQLNGSLNTIGSCTDSSSVCILDRPGDLAVGNTSDFTCDNWGVFFVEGNLTISRDVLNGNDSKDACIFVVKGNVVIKEGSKKSTLSQIQYDKLNAYILADGTITVDPELGASTKYDGLFVSGGLHSLSGISMNRSLKLSDRNTYPALVVRYQSKYSVLSNLVFGSQIDILKTELGFKPY